MIYLDTSAFVKLIWSERETEALQAFLAARSEVLLVSSALLVVEARRAVQREDPAHTSRADLLLTRVGQVGVTRAVLEAASRLPDPSIRSLVPSDITIRRNHFHKPLSWFESRQWGVKNLFELKNAQYVTIEGNVFERNWVDQQNGMAILFTPRNQDRRCTWCIVQYVTFEHNIVRHSAAGANVLGYDDIHRSKQLSHVTIRNNLWQDISDAWGASNAAGRLFQILNKTDHVTIDHNTGLGTKAVTFSVAGANTNFVFTNNVVRHNHCAAGDNNCGMAGDGQPPGLPALNQYFVSPIVEDNVMFEGNETGQWSYPVPNFFPLSVRLNGDFTLNMSDPSNAPYVDGTGAPLGIDASVDTATTGVVQYTNP